MTDELGEDLGVTRERVRQGPYESAEDPRA